MTQLAINVTPIQRASRICALVVFVIGALGAAGWVFDVDVLQRIHTPWVTMKFNAAVSLVLAAVSLFLQQEEAMGRGRRLLAQGCAAVVMLIGLLTLVENLFGWDLGIDQLVFKESLEAAGMSFPGRMGVCSAIVVSCMGGALFFLDRKVGGKYLTGWLASAAAVATTLVFIYYFYGLGEGSRFARWLTISLHAVVAFYTLAIGVILVRPQRGLMLALMGPSTGSMMVRRMLPMAIGLPMVMGLLAMQAHRGGVLGTGFAMSAFVLAVILIFTLFIHWTANELDRNEAARLQEILEAAEDLRASDMRIRLATEATEVGIWEWNVKTEQLRWDAQMFRIYGMEETLDGVVPYEAWSNAVLPGDRARQEAVLKLTRTNERTRKPEFRIVRQNDGERRIIESVEIARLNAAGEVEWVVGTNLDVTERRRVEVLRLEAIAAAEAASKAKDDFLAALSHELRTPLTPVLMMASSLELDMNLPQETREQLGMMRRNVELEARIIDDLLDMTRIRLGKVSLALEVADLHELVGHTSEVVLSDFLGKGVHLGFTMSAERHHVLVDPARLQQVLWNLVKNAIKFTPAGGTISVTTRNDDEGRVVLSVADTGAGISAEALPKIFRAFEQGDAKGQHRFGGLGLGLAISHAIVVAHGGTILGESSGVGMGATFSVSLETVDAPAAFTQASESQSAPVRALRLLIVEDHETTRAVLTQLLKKHGHSVAAVGTVQAALSAFAAEHFDVVVSDLGLPDGSGLDLMREVQRLRPVPAIALSGYGMEGDLLETKAAGFSAHLVKPVNIMRLRLLIEQLAVPNT